MHKKDLFFQTIALKTQGLFWTEKQSHIRKRSK